MNAQQLRNSILQEAIEGRLVPQDPNDEPASALLERIREEKKRLVKEGKLKKKDLEETPISEDEIPFEIPESWEWVRLADIFEHSSGKQLRASDTEGTLHEYITTSNLYWGRFELNKLKSMYYKDSEIEKCTAKKGDLLVCEGGDIGRSAIWSYDYDICLQNHVHRLRPYDSQYTIFIFYIMWYYKSVGLIGGKGIGIQGLSASALKSIILPLPPLAEQKRIVAKIEELLPKVEEYGKAQDALNKLNEELPEKLKKSVLQEAIEGRLVPQDPSDEPASVLLERIREEKKQLVKEGKLKKKDLEETPISDDEIPFEIPESWEWVRLGEISTYAITKKKINASQADPNLWGLDLEDIEKGGRLVCLKSVGERKAIGDKTCFSEGDILYSKLRPYLLKILIAPKNGICTPEIIPFTCYGCICKEFIVYLLKSAYVDDYINSVTFGVKMPRVSTETMVSLVIPLPPLAEQKRIVAKIEEVFAEIDKLK